MLTTMVPLHAFLITHVIPTWKLTLYLLTTLMQENPEVQGGILVFLLKFLVCFFTKRAVKIGEELCFDYKYVASTNPSRVNLKNKSEYSIECKCGSANCKKILWSLEIK